MVVDAFPAHQVPVREAEDRLGTQHGQVIERRFLDDVGVAGRQQGVHEPERLLFQGRDAGHDLFGRRPGVVVFPAVIVALDALGPAEAVRKTPGEIEGEGLCMPGRERLFDGERGHRVVFAGRLLFAQNPVGAEIVPEVEEGPVPAVAFRRGSVADPLIRGRHEGDGAPGLMVPRDAFRIKVYAAEAAAAAEFIDILLGVILLAVAADEVAQGPADRDFEGGAGDVRHFVGKHGDGQAALVGVGRHKGVEALDADADRDLRVREAHLAEGIGGVEGCVAETGQAEVVHGGAGRAVVFVGVERTGEHRGGAASLRILDVDREEGGVALGGAGVEVLGRDVHDLPVAQLPAAAEGHGAGADAAQRKGDFLQVGRIIVRQDGPFGGGPFLCGEEEGEKEGNQQQSFHNVKDRKSSARICLSLWKW